MANGMTVSRRDVLKRAALLLGVGAVSPAVSSVVLAAADAEVTKQPRLLKADQLRLVATLADIILPATDTPGAKDAGVHHYIDALLADYFSLAHRTRFMSGLSAVDERAQAQGFERFLAADSAAQLALVKAMDAEAFGTKAEHHVFFREFKELTLVGYYTSKVGATQELRYQPVPGPYQGCVPYDELGRAWATG